MQIFYLSPIWIVIISVILWPTFQYGAILISRKLPSKYFSPDNFIFRQRKWEFGGALYEKVFLVKKWKKYLPDGAAVQKGGYRKRHLNDFSAENLNLFIEETCRGELGHLLAILPFWVFGLYAPSIIIWIMLVYAVIVNLPCAIAQRYNRPRLRKYVENRNLLRKNLR